MKGTGRGKNSKPWGRPSSFNGPLSQKGGQGGADRTKTMSWGNIQKGRGKRRGGKGEGVSGATGNKRWENTARLRMGGGGGGVGSQHGTGKGGLELSHSRV